MSKTIEAIFENGALKPLGKINAKEHERFKIILLPIDEEDSSFHLLRMAEEGRSFDFLKEKEEDIYSAKDGEEL